MNPIQHKDNNEDNPAIALIDAQLLSRAARAKSVDKFELLKDAELERSPIGKHLMRMQLGSVFLPHAAQIFNHNNKGNIDAIDDVDVSAHDLHKELIRATVNTDYNESSETSGGSSDTSSEGTSDTSSEVSSDTSSERTSDTSSEVSSDTSSEASSDKSSKTGSDINIQPEPIKLEPFAESEDALSSAGAISIKPKSNLSVSSLHESAAQPEKRYMYNQKESFHGSDFKELFTYNFGDPRVRQLLPRKYLAPIENNAGHAGNPGKLMGLPICLQKSSTKRLLSESPLILMRKKRRCGELEPDQVDKPQVKNRQKKNLPSTSNQALKTHLQLKELEHDLGSIMQAQTPDSEGHRT